MNKKKVTGNKSVSASTKSIPMGLGPLGNPKLTFVRKFRWTLECESLEPHWVQGPLEIDYLKKEIKFSVMEIGGNETINAHTFQQAIIKWPASECLTLATWDGCGNLIYQREFSSVKALSVKQTFDYNSCNVSSMDFVLGFGISTVKLPQKLEVGKKIVPVS